MERSWSSQPQSDVGRFTITDAIARPNRDASARRSFRFIRRTHRNRARATLRWHQPSAETSGVLWIISTGWSNPSANSSDVSQRRGLGLSADVSPSLLTTLPVAQDEGRLELPRGRTTAVTGGDTDDSTVVWTTGGRRIATMIRMHQPSRAHERCRRLWPRLEPHGSSLRRRLVVERATLRAWSSGSNPTARATCPILTARFA